MVGGGEVLITVGKITQPHGTRGQVKVATRTEWIKCFRMGSRVCIEREGDVEEWVEVEKVGIHHERLILKVGGIDTREKAETLREAILKVPRDVCLPFQENAYLVSELIGSVVKTVDEEEVGRIIDVLHMPAQDVFVVDKKGKEVMIPAVKAFVKQIDLIRGEIIIQPIEGLLD
jgi:16S rRNA processing protein RimM